MNKKRATSALLSLSLLGLIPTSSYAKKDDTFWALVGAGVLATGVYCIYNYLSETDEEVLDDACDKVVKYKKQYLVMTQLLGQYARERNVALGDAVCLAHNPSEEFLVSLAVEKREKVNTYISRLSNAAYDVNNSYKKLKKRTDKQPDYALQNKMSSALHRTETLYNELHALEAFFSKNHIYFTLCEQEVALGEKYAEEFRVLVDTYGNELAQANGIRHYVITKSKTRSLPFPRVEYVNRIDRDIQALDKNIKSAHNQYQARLASAYHYLQTLESVRGYIVNDVQFEQERYKYQEDQREKERLRIEQEKSESERRKAIAAEREARAREEHNRIEREKQIYGEKKTVHVMHHNRG